MINIKLTETCKEAILCLHKNGFNREQIHEVLGLVPRKTINQVIDNNSLMDRTFGQQ